MKQTTLLTAAMLAAAATFAAGAASAAAAAKLPAEHSQGAATWITGGVGRDEAAAMRRAESKYPLALEFVGRTKAREEFLSDVAVTIKDGAGKTALAATSDGPYLLAKLPDGKYTITAEDKGKSESRTVMINAKKHERVTFSWAA